MAHTWNAMRPYRTLLGSRGRRPERIVVAKSMVNMKGQHRASHRLSHVSAMRAAVIFRSIPALVSSAMLTRIVTQIGKIMPNENDHIIKSSVPQLKMHNKNKSLLTLYSYYAMCIPVHPGRGLGHDGGFDGVDVAPAGGVKRSSYSREPRSCPADTRIRALKGS